MKKNWKKLLAVVLVLVMILAFVACAAPRENSDQSKDGVEKSFEFVVVNEAGEETSFDIATTEETVGAALIAEELIEGEDGAYGLYVTTVNGEYHKYEDDGMYWAFYVDDEYATSGVDSTEVEDGAVYSLKAEK